MNTAALLVLTASLAATPVPVPDAALPRPTPRPLDVRPVRDVGLTLGGAVLWVGSETLLKGRLAPAHCIWCDRDAAGTETLNALDRWGRGIAGSPLQQRRADTLSNVVDFGLLPAAAMGTGAWLALEQGGVRTAAEDTLVVVQTAVLSAVANQGVKFLVGRERPFVLRLAPEQRPLTAHPDDNNLSFYSGHSSFAFALAVSAGTVAELRGYEGRGWVWAVGLPLAASVPVLRMVADKHYLTDVALGSAVGAAFGVGVPLLLHRERGQGVGGMHLSVSAGPRGFAVSGAF